MRFIGKFFAFWYDFIVGDDWRIAVGVIVALSVGAVLVSAGVSDTVVAAVALGSIVVGLALSLGVERRKRRAA